MAFDNRILTIHKNKADIAIAKLTQAYQNGDIMYESDLLHSLTKELSSLYSSLREPSLTPIPLRKGHLPRISAVRDPFRNIQDDLDLYYEQMFMLSDAVKHTANMCAVERKGLSELLHEAQSNLVSVRSWSSDSDPTFLWVTETFKSMSKIMRSSNTRIDTARGLATLPVVGERSLADRVAHIDITHSGSDDIYADGIPGNSLEISSPGYALNPELVEEPSNPVFVGSTHKNTSDPTAMFDNDPTTWFEWERYYVPTVQNIKAQGYAYVTSDNNVGDDKSVIGEDSVTKDYGWKYTIKWPDGDDPSAHWVVTPWQQPTSPDISQELSLNLRVDFNDSEELSWIELLPFLPSDRDGNVITATLTSVQVSEDGNAGWEELLTRPLVLNPNLSQPIDAQYYAMPVKDHLGTAVVPCHLPRVRSIRIRLTQPTPYLTRIAHQFYIKQVKVTVRKKILFYSNTKTYERWLRVPNEDMAPISESESGFSLPVIGSLWGTSRTYQDMAIYSFYDIFSAYRYSLGIRDLGLYNRVYAESGSLVSRQLLFSKPVRAASLIVGEIIPEGWSTNVSWISYEISTDGTNWKPISPQNTSAGDNSVVEFAPTTKLYLRASFKRPTDRPTESPVLNYFTIKAIPEDSV